MLLNSFKKELSEMGKLNFSKRNKTYENFLAPNGYRQQEVHTEYWWSEDFVHDLIIKDRLFETSPVLKTREVELNNDQQLRSIVKGPFSPVDLWVPGKAFIEIKYCGSPGRDNWGYDWELKNIWNLGSLVDSYKVFLVVVHKVWKKGWVVSMVDVTKELKIYSGAPYKKICVREENCFKRWENMSSFMRSYREGDRPWKSLIKRKYLAGCHDE
tara:strand:- start:85 stop:723 length:639 start_codon:yes stop_codon:yes gene_type:complete